MWCNLNVDYNKWGNDNSVPSSPDRNRESTESGRRGLNSGSRSEMRREVEGMFHDVSVLEQVQVKDMGEEAWATEGCFLKRLVLTEYEGTEKHLLISPFFGGIQSRNSPSVHGYPAGRHKNHLRSKLPSLVTVLNTHKSRHSVSRD